VSIGHASDTRATQFFQSPVNFSGWKIRVIDASEQGPPKTLSSTTDNYWYLLRPTGSWVVPEAVAYFCPITTFILRTRNFHFGGGDGEHCLNTAWALSLSRLGAFKTLPELSHFACRDNVLFGHRSMMLHAYRAAVHAILKTRRFNVQPLSTLPLQQWCAILQCC
jgi:hypothetical protein